MENQLKHNINFPINNQLINLIVDKTNTIGELKSIINSKEINPEIPIHELTELLEKMQKELELKDQKIKLLEDAYIKKQQRKDYPEKNVIYMLTTEDHKNKRLYIIGKAKDLKCRLSGYNKTAEHEVVYYKECKSEDAMNIIEVMVLTKLKEYKEKANRDRFVLPIENDIVFFTNIIDLCVNFYN
jgi:thioredoxin reductase